MGFVVILHFKIYIFHRSLSSSVYRHLQVTSIAHRIKMKIGFQVNSGNNAKYGSIKFDQKIHVFVFQEF
jgi:hypothetical protein